MLLFFSDQSIHGERERHTHRILFCRMMWFRSLCSFPFSHSLLQQSTVTIVIKYSNRSLQSCIQQFGPSIDSEFFFLLLLDPKLVEGDPDESGAQKRSGTIDQVAAHVPTANWGPYWVGFRRSVSTSCLGVVAHDHSASGSSCSFYLQAQRL